MVTAFFLLLAYTQYIPVTSIFAERSIAILLPLYWLYVGGALASALIGVVVWKYEASPYDYDLGVKWWLTILASIMFIAFAHVLPIRRSQYVGYTFLMGIGVYVLALGIIQIIDKVRKFGR